MGSLGPKARCQQACITIRVLWGLKKWSGYQTLFQTVTQTLLPTPELGPVVPGTSLEEELDLQQ